jgi:hypothetical protein
MVTRAKRHREKGQRVQHTEDSRGASTTHRGFKGGEYNTQRIQGGRCHLQLGAGLRLRRSSISGAGCVARFKGCSGGGGGTLLFRLGDDGCFRHDCRQRFAA